MLTSRWGAQELARFHRGDPDLFRVLVNDLSPRLMALAVSYIRDPDDARDLVQETWLRAYRKRSQFTGDGSLVGWLYAICRNICADSYGKGANRERLAPETHLVEHPADFETDDAVQRRELRRSLYDALCALPARERDVAVLRLVEGFSTRETANRLQCAEGTVKAALHHAIQKLKTSMEVWVS